MIIKYITLLVFCLLALNVRRGMALAVIVASMVIWTEYTRFEIFITQMSVTRFIVVIIIIRFWSKAKLELNSYDKLFFVYWVTSLIMKSIAGADSKLMITTTGRCFDTFMVYFAARVCLTDKGDFKDFVDFIKYPAIVAALLAVYESQTATSLYTSLRQANAWAWSFDTYEARLGSWVRAFGTTLQPIYWGMTMLFTTMLYLASNAVSQKQLTTPTLFFMCLGVFFSLSTGPIGSMIIVLMLTFLINTKQRFTLFLQLFLVASIMIEIFSNRHFYDMAQYFAMNSVTAWYRSKLMTVAFKNIGEYIFVGVGGNWPNHWARQIDGRALVDVVNQYLVVALNGGIVLLGMYLYLVFSPIVRFYKNWNRSLTPLLNGYRIMAFSLITVALAGFTVGFYNPFEILLYIMLGMTRQLEILCQKEYQEFQFVETSSEA